MNISKIASAAFNSIVSGLSGYHVSINIPLKLLEDEICETRLNLIYKYYLKNLLPTQELYRSLNCIKVDCNYIEKCCGALHYSKKIAHFEIPLLALGIGEDAISYIGTVNKEIKFKVYFNNSFKFNKYKLRRKDSPYVYIDTTVNANGKLDGYIYNAPLLEIISVVGIFKDDRQFDEAECCVVKSDNDLSSIDIEVKDTVVKKYIQYYRLLYLAPVPNDQVPK